MEPKDIILSLKHKLALVEQLAQLCYDGRYYRNHPEVNCKDRKRILTDQLKNGPLSITRISEGSWDVALTEQVVSNCQRSNVKDDLVRSVKSRPRKRVSIVDDCESQSISPLPSLVAPTQKPVEDPGGDVNLKNSKINVVKPKPILVTRPKREMSIGPDRPQYTELKTRTKTKDENNTNSILPCIDFDEIPDHKRLIG